MWGVGGGSMGVEATQTITQHNSENLQKPLDIRLRIWYNILVEHIQYTLTLVTSDSYNKTKEFIKNSSSNSIIISIL